MTASAEVKAVAAALAADEGREVFASDYPRAIRFINALSDRRVTLEHELQMSPANWKFTDSIIARDQARSRLSASPITAKEG